MSLDERARQATEAVRDHLGALDVPDAATIPRRVRRMRTRRALAGTVAVALVAAGIVALITGRDDSTHVVATAPPRVDLPAGSSAEGSWASVPYAAAGLADAVGGFDAATRDGLPVMAASAIAPRSSVSGSQPTPALWRSDDGLHWEAALTPSAPGRIVAIDQGGGGGLAIGIDEHDPDSKVWFVWRSDDGGSTWTEIARDPGVFATGDTPIPGDAPWVTDMRRVGDLWVAFGTPDRAGIGVWTSVDGAAWQLAAAAAAEEAPWAITAVALENGMLTAYGIPLRTGVLPGDVSSRPPEPALWRWRTDDPTSWGEPEPVFMPADAVIQSVSRDSSRAITFEQVPSPGRLFLARSTDDGLTWERDQVFAAQHPDAQPYAVLRTRDAWVVAGLADDDHFEAWISSDGVEWGAMPFDPPRVAPGGLVLVSRIGERVLFLVPPPVDSPPRLFIYDPAADFVVRGSVSTSVDCVDVGWAPPDPQALPTSTTGAAQATDLSAVTEAEGRTLEDAAADRRVADEVGRVSGEIAERRPDAFVGSALGEGPGGRPVVYVKGSADDAIREIVRRAAVEICLVDDQPYSRDELDERTSRVGRALAEAGYEDLAVGADITDAGTIRVTVFAPPGLPDDPDMILAALPDDLRDGVVITVTHDVVSGADAG